MALRKGKAKVYLKEIRKKGGYNMNTTDEIYDYLIDYGIAPEKEISLVCSINGTNEDSLNSILYSRTGYRDIEQIKEEEEYDK